MRLFDYLTPDIFLESITELSVELLREKKLRGLVLDIDNTMSPPDSRESYDGVSRWADEMREGGMKLVILSNNRAERVAPYADSLGIEYICDIKPRKKAYVNAAKLIGLEPCECCAVGDQIFTDILGGRRSGCFCCLVKPQSPDQTAFIRFKRLLEKPVLRRISTRRKA